LLGTALAAGRGGWAEAYIQARALVSQMNDEEKNEILIGEGLGARGCSTFSKGLTRLGFTGLCYQDAESGVRTGQLVNGYAAQLSVGASWNRELTYARGKYIGAEFKAKGANVLLGPVVGPLGRVARGGRNWEGFSNDPYLAGALVHPTIRGMQESVISCVKHLVGNEQETHRLPFSAGLFKPPIRANQSLSSNMDDRTMHELYLWPFYDAVRAGAASVMTAYTKVNGSDSSANSKVLNGLLKTELGFQGFVISDWYGQHTGVASADAGLDVALPSSVYWSQNKLATAVSNGTLDAARLDDMVVRMLAAWYRYAKLENPGMAFNVAVDARDPAAEDTIFQGAVEGHVLVKNVNNALPLSKPKSLGIYGFDAVNSPITSKRSFKYPLSMLNTHTFTDGTPFADINCALLFTTIAKAGTVGPDVALNGTLITGGGSGGCSPHTTIAPYDAFLAQSKLDDTDLHTDFWSVNPTVDPTTDAAIVFVNEQASEAWDRVSLASPYADELIKNVAAQHKNTIVVIHNAGVRLVDRWYDNPNITAVIYGHLPGQASGPALTEIMYGRQSPSGRLPYTVGKSEGDYGDLLSPTLATAENPFYAQSDFEEGLHIDYKAFIKADVTPRFPFGFGLTYTTFTYSSLRIAKNAAANSSPFPPDAAASPSTVAPEGGLESLYDTLLTVTAVITNTGHTHAAAEVAQLYLGIPGSGVEKVLRGFDKVMIKPGETAQVRFPLRRRDVSVWDVVAQQWRIPAGAYQVYVGKNVLDEEMLTGTVELIPESAEDVKPLVRVAAESNVEQFPM
jgi:beta-glucosidase